MPARASLRQIRAVIFDMDGTLLDSERLSHKAWDAAAREVGGCVSWEIFLKMVGHRSADCMRILQESSGKPLPAETVMASAREHYARLVGAGVPLMPGAEAIFDFAKQRGWKIGIATSTRRESARAKLEHAGLWQHVDAATCGDEVAVGKPHPEIYATTANPQFRCPRSTPGRTPAPPEPLCRYYANPARCPSQTSAPLFRKNNGCRHAF